MNKPILSNLNAKLAVAEVERVKKNVITHDEIRKRWKCWSGTEREFARSLGVSPHHTAKALWGGNSDDAKEK